MAKGQHTDPEFPTLEEAAVVPCDIVRVAAVCQVGDLELDLSDVVVRVLRVGRGASVSSAGRGSGEGRPERGLTSRSICLIATKRPVGI